MTILASRQCGERFQIKDISGMDEIFIQIPDNVTKLGASLEPERLVIFARPSR
jgi:hypothetical protein